MHSKIQSFSTHLKARRLATGTQDMSGNCPASRPSVPRPGLPC